MILPDQDVPTLHTRTVRNPLCVAVLGAALLITILFGAFVGLQVISPSDGGRLQPGDQVWQRDGVLVTPLREQPDGLREGDLVVAVDGRSMEAWAQDLFASDDARPHWELGQTVIYTVVRDGQRANIPVQLMPYSLAAVLAHEWGTFLFVLTALLVTAFAFHRRPNDSAAGVLFLWSVSILGASTWLIGLQVHDLVGETGFWLYKITSISVYTVFWTTGLHFALIFPQRHPIVVKHRWLLPCIYIMPHLLYLLYILLIRSQSVNTLDWLRRWVIAEGVVALVYLTLMVTAVVWGYRTSYDAVSRQKVRWVVFATCLSGGGSLFVWALPTLILGHAIISTNLLGLLLLPFPVALAIAIVRHHLFDIDVIIRRTLIYGTLTAILAANYWGGVIVLQRLMVPVIGPGSPLAIVASTLAIAALFQPLRRYVQNLIDRRFYRRKYDAQKTLQGFSAQLRDETDLNKLSDDLLAVVQETLQPKHVSLWLTMEQPPERRIGS